MDKREAKTVLSARLWLAVKPGQDDSYFRGAGLLPGAGADVCVRTNDIINIEMMIFRRRLGAAEVHLEPHTLDLQATQATHRR